MIHLRPIELKDTENIIRWRNTESVLMNFIDRTELTAEIHKKWLDNHIFSGKAAQMIISTGAQQKHRNTETQKHRNTETQKHRNTETQKHRNTETQKHRNTETQKHDIGTVFLKDIDRIHRKAEFGIFIGEEMERGKGYGLEATQQMIDYAFFELKLHKLYLRVLKTNKAAIRVYEKAGFRKIGIFEDDVFVDNSYLDIVFMEILNKEDDNT